jgi:hypothetical protein
MAMSTPGPHRLDLGQALQDGWRAFARNPWMFLLFGLLLFGLEMLLQVLLQPRLPLAWRPSTWLTGASPWTWSPCRFDEGVLDCRLDLNAVDWPKVLRQSLQLLRYGLVVLCQAVLLNGLSLLLHLWGTSGLIRGAWLALEGRRLQLADFSHWDGRALLRLALPSFLLSWGLGLVFAMAGLLAVVLGGLQPWLALLPLLAALGGCIYLSVSQFFLPQLALLHDPNALDTLQAGHRQVDRHWDQVAGLALLSFALLLAGAVLGIGIGLLIAWPVVLCIQTAAYRQLFGPVDQTGFSARGPAPALAAGPAGASASGEFGRDAFLSGRDRG